MKKITCIQQYVIDNLIKDEILSTNSLLGAVSKVCSEEQFNNILSILIETPFPCTDVPKLERKEDSGNKTNLVRMSMFVPEEASGSTKMDIIKILKNQFNLSLNQTKEYVDSCIGKFNILPRTITQEDIDIIVKKLEPYNVFISTAGFY
jgi:ribosomal protein L7/L12|nr:MAG TPA: 50S ribosomal protein [Caudoviricetes sp.]